jgi:flagellar hook protein FlgE
MYSAIAGLKTHMSNLNVIGNNIANVNTTAYKASSSVFRTELYTSLKSGSNGTTVTGGVNPSQIGYGSSLATVRIDMSTGTYNATGNATDCMIDGDGFFLVGDKDVANTIDGEKPSTFTSLTLTRVGDFSFKADGYLTDGEGSVVYGFMTVQDENGETSICDQLVPIRYPGYSEDEDGNITIEYAVLDDNGVLTDATDEETQAKYPFAQLDSVSIDPSTGKITGTSKDTDEIVTIGYIAIGNVTNPDGVTLESGSYYKAGEGAGDLTITMLGGAAKSINEAQPNSAFEYVNGSLSEDQDNMPDGARILSSGTTSLITGGLESSKTDLATEIANMITTQRGYQANTRIITVTDSMLEELVNMKR